MDAFIKFLLDYYIWILAVLGIVIVTIIGFLVDSKQKRKNKELHTDKLSNTDKPMEDVTMINNQNSVPVVDAISQTVHNTVDNVIENDSSDIYNLNNSAQNQEQNASYLSNETSVQSDNDAISLSGQKPHFEPRNVNIPVSKQPVNSNLNSQIITPQPVNAVSINQPVQQPVYSGVPNNQQYMQASSVRPVQNVQPIYQNNINTQTEVQPTSNVTTPAFNNNNNMSNSRGAIQQNNSNIQNSIVQSQQLSNSVNSNMSFAIGGQQQSNSDDMWKL